MTDERFSRADKIRLRAAHVQLLETNDLTVKDGGPDLLSGGRNLADVMRHALPDMDPIDLGRVLLEMSDFMEGVYSSGAHCGAILAMGIQARAAGMDLTAPEWEEIPS